MRSQTRKWITDSAEINLAIAFDKSLFLTNKIGIVANCTADWSNWRVTDSAKLVGIRFKLKENLDIDFTNQ